MVTAGIDKPAIRERIPVYRRVASAIEARIQGEEWGIGERLPTDLELADALGVHWQTVHRAMRDLQRQGRVTRHPRTGTHVAPQVYGFAILLADEMPTIRETEFYDLMARALLRQCSGPERAGHVVYAPVSNGYFEPSPDLARLMKHGLIHGVVTTFALLPERLQRDLEKQGVPFAAVTAVHGLTDAVMIDTDGVTALGLDYLAWSGCRRVGVLYHDHGRNNEPISLPELVADNRFEQVWRLHTRIADMRHGLEAGEALLAQRPDIDGLLVPDDVIARGACMAVLKRGRAVPDTLKVACHWNRSSHFDYPFPVARLETDPAEAIRLALEILERRRRGAGPAAVPVLVRPKLIPPQADGR